MYINIASFRIKLHLPTLLIWNLMKLVDWNKFQLSFSVLIFIFSNWRIETIQDLFQKLQPSKTVRSTKNTYILRICLQYYPYIMNFPRSPSNNNENHTRIIHISRSTMRWHLTPHHLLPYSTDTIKYPSGGTDQSFSQNEVRFTELSRLFFTFNCFNF